MPPLADGSFDATLMRAALGPLRRESVATVQINVGKVCNQACHHCHVDAGPKRTESMSGETVERILLLIEQSPAVGTVDITGGAPELNAHFRALVTGSRSRGRRVIDRCNLTVAAEPGMDGLFEFLAAEQVAVVCSLPCYTAENVDKQRGGGVFRKSVDALRRLNELGYGRVGSALTLDLVYNPLGASLPGEQKTLEDRYREELGSAFGIEFHRLMTLTNMPISRFAEQLRRSGDHDRYMGLLVNHFNPATVTSLMCRSLVSVSWDGRLYDCDFNQMLELPLGTPVRTIRDITSFDALDASLVTTGMHCFGCTAGAGSSCSGALQAGS